ncbi:MAG: dTDP-4-dehydrorhamnose 3,5-epimerase family protein [Chloroflexota bacterium]
MASNQPYVQSTSIPDLVVVERPTLGDERGFFREIERRPTDVDASLDRAIVHRQWNHSRSTRGVLLGIHVARWAKCVYVVRGEVQAVAVDLRPDSEHFGKHESFELGDSRRAMIVVPSGCGNAFLVLSDVVDYLYSVDQEWYPGGEFGIAWDDPDLAIDWRIEGMPILSAKDQTLPRARERFPEKFR